MIEGWEEKTLGDAPFQVIDGDRGKAYPKKTEFESEGHCLFLNTKNVTNSGFVFEELSFITEERDKLLRKGKLERNDIVLTTRGTVGNVAFYSDNIPYDHIRINSGMIIIRPTGINASFSHQLFKFLKPEFDSFATGSAQPQLPIRDLKLIVFFLPPPNQQKAIAEVLSSLDDKIDLLHRQNATLEALAETLFRQTFIEEAQDDWEEGTISQLIEVQAGYAFKSADFNKEGCNAVIKIKNIQGNIINIKEADHLNENLAKDIDLKFLVSSGDVLLAMTGAKIGKLGIVPKTNSNIWLNQRVAMLRPKYPYAQYLAYLFFQSDEGQDYIQNTGSGSAQPNISSSELESAPFPIFGENDIIDFSDHIFPFFKRTIFNLGQIQTLEKLRDTLLPKLMSGAVRVEYERLDAETKAA